MSEVIQAASEPLILGRTDIPITMMGKVPVINTSGLTIYPQWAPPSHYLYMVLTAWRRAVREVYGICQAEIPKKARYGLIYGKESSGRHGDTFFVGAWMVSVPGDGGSLAFRRRFTELKPYPLKTLMIPMAVVEVTKSIKNEIDSW